MKTKAMLLNDREFKDIKNIVRKRIEWSNSLPLASDIYVYPEYPSGWLAVFGVMDPITKFSQVVAINSVWGSLQWEHCEPCGFLPSGALAFKSDRLSSPISESLRRSEDERLFLLENTGWTVQFTPCGHMAELHPSNPIVEKAKARTQLDALILPISQCPICNTEVDKTLYRIIYE